MFGRRMIALGKTALAILGVKHRGRSAKDGCGTMQREPCHAPTLVAELPRPLSLSGKLALGCRRILATHLRHNWPAAGAETGVSVVTVN
jgi:hypothetical protein